MTTASPPANHVLPAPSHPFALRAYWVAVWHAVAGTFALLFALMLLFPGTFRGNGPFFDTVLDKLQSIGTSTIFRWATPEFIEGVIIVLLSLIGVLLLAQIPGLLQFNSRARMVSISMNYIGMVLSAFFMLRQMTVNSDVLLSMIDDPIDSGPLYDLVDALPGALATLIQDGYWLDRLAQGMQVLPFVVLFGLSAALLFGSRVGEAYGETLAQREAIYAYLYISPYLLLASIFTIGLFILAFYLSFNDLDLFGPATWVGLENYRDALEDPKFLISLSNVAWYALIVVTLQTAISLLLAVAMNARFAGRRFFRTLFYAPSVTSPVVISLIFMWLFSGRGFVNKVVFDTLNLGPAITDLGIRIPPGSPGLQWFNTPNRLGDLTFLKPFFDGSWPNWMAGFTLALALIMGLRIAMWLRFQAFDRTMARYAAGLAAAGGVLGMVLLNVAGAYGLVEGLAYSTTLAVVIAPLILNRLRFDVERTTGQRSMLLGAGTWWLVVAGLAAITGDAIGQAPGFTAVMGLGAFSLIVATALVRSGATRTRETEVIEWANIEDGGLLRTWGRLSVIGGASLPVLLGLIVATMALIAHQTLGYSQPTEMPDNAFVPLIVRGPSVAFMSVMVMNIFTTAPTFMIMYLAALQDIPVQLYEAAEIDGANQVQRFFKITIPMLRPVTLLIVVLGTIGTLQIFDQIAIITRGGPLNTTLTPVYLIYTTALGDNIRAQVGYASAMAFILGVIIFVFTFIQRRYLERGTEQY